MLNPRRRAPSPELIYFGQQQLISFFQNIFSDHSRTPKGQCLWLTKNWKSCLTEFRCTVRSGPHWSTRIKKKSSCLQTKLCIAVSSFCHYSLRVVYDLTWLFVCTIWHCLRTWRWNLPESTLNMDRLKIDGQGGPTSIHCIKSRSNFWKTHRSQAGRPLMLTTAWLISFWLINNWYYFKDFMVTNRESQLK